jgi:hypothetical protein
MPVLVDQADVRDVLLQSGRSAATREILLLRQKVGTDVDGTVIGVLFVESIKERTQHGGLRLRSRVAGRGVVDPRAPLACGGIGDFFAEDERCLCRAPRRSG